MPIRREPRSATESNGTASIHTGGTGRASTWPRRGLPPSCPGARTAAAPTRFGCRTSVVCTASVIPRCELLAARAFAVVEASHPFGGSLSEALTADCVAVLVCCTVLGRGGQPDQRDPVAGQLQQLADLTGEPVAAAPFAASPPGPRRLSRCSSLAGRQTPHPRLRWMQRCGSRRGERPA